MKLMSLGQAEQQSSSGKQKKLYSNTKYYHTRIIHEARSSETLNTNSDLLIIKKKNI